MIIVRVELWSAITGNVKELARMEIANMGDSLKKSIGNYHVRTLKGRSADTLAKRTTQRTAYVLKHRRLAEHVWNLVAKALQAMNYGEN